MTTQENTDLTDEITQEQQGIDQEQGIIQEGQAGPSNQQLLERLEALEQQNQRLTAENRGVQSLYSKGLNAIRDDMQTRIDDQIASMQGKATRENFLAQLETDEERDRYRYLFEEIDSNARPVTAPPAEAPAVNTPSNTDIQEAVFQYVEKQGLSRSNPKINYGVLADTSLTTQERQARFLISLGEARTAEMGSPAQQPVAQLTQAAQAQTANPPVESGRQAPLNSLRSQGEIRDAYIEGRLSTPEDPNGTQDYTKRMAAIGISV